jgi:hypothetical protein
MTALAVALLLGVAGCQKVNYSNTPELGPTQVWEAAFDPPSYSQTIHATIEPESCSVSAYLVKKSDADSDVRAALEAGKVPDAGKCLAAKTYDRIKQSQAENFTLDATVPAKTGYVLFVVGGNKTTKVRVKVVGK